VLKRLNDAFPMDKHNDKYFTIWYGVYRRATRQLAYASGGHPPALLRGESAGGASGFRQLGGRTPLIGMMPGVTYQTYVVELDSHAQLYVYSDGVYEIALADGNVWPFEEFVQFLESQASAKQPLDGLLAHVRRLGGSEVLADDFSIMRICF
jgi:sigma-B regulation protein RsbU (phosphoserine phosphatase)